MSVDRINKHIGPGGLLSDLGLEGLLPSPEFEAPLPPMAALEPIEVDIVPLIVQYLARASIEDLLFRTMRPVLSDRLLLLPERFQLALENALVALEAALEAPPEAGDDEESAPPAAGKAVGGQRLWRRTRKIVREEIALRELLAFYRSALLQG